MPLRLVVMVALLLCPTLGWAQPGTTFQPANPWMFVTGTTIRTVPSITQVRTPELVPLTDDGAALGSTTRSWADLFLASGGVINFNNGDVTLTHAADVLTLAGGNFDIGANSLIFTDATLVRDAAQIISHRNGTNAQESRIENTFTDTSNREFASLGFINNADVFTIQTEALGTGTARNILIQSAAALTLRAASSQDIRFEEGTTLRWFIDDTDGAFKPGLTNSTPIGHAAARPLQLFAGTSGIDSTGQFFVSADLANPFRMTRSAAAAAGPGADTGSLRWETGTNAGTLKLVGYSGTSATGVTIVDNVGGGN